MYSLGKISYIIFSVVYHMYICISYVHMYIICTYVYHMYICISYVYHSTLIKPVFTGFGVS